MTVFDERFIKQWASILLGIVVIAMLSTVMATFVCHDTTKANKLKYDQWLYEQQTREIK